MKRKLALALMLVLMLLMLVPFEALAQEIVYSPLYVVGDFGNSFSGRKSWYDGGYWVTWIKGTTAYYSFSVTGGVGSWGAPQTITTGVPADNGNALAVWYDGSYIHFSAAKSSTALAYRMGDSNPSTGAIDWLAAEQTISLPDSENHWYVGMTICTDSNGLPWVAYESGWYHIPVHTSSTNNGTWTENIAKATVILDKNGHGAFTPTLLPLTGGKLALVSCDYGYITTRRYNGSNWDTPINSASYMQAIGGGGQYSATVQDDVVHIVFLKATTYDMYYTYWNYNTYGPETLLMNGAETDISPTISRDTTDNSLHVFWVDEPTDDHVYYKTYNYLIGNWSATYDLVDESIGSLLPTTSYQINSDPLPARANVGVYYVAGTTSYNSSLLKFKLLDEAFHVDTLTPNPLGNTYATLRGEIMSLGFGSATERGFLFNTSPTDIGAILEGNETGTFNVGVFTHGITGLLAAHTYWYIAYASGDYGTSWGNWTSFYTTSPPAPTPPAGNVTGDSATICSTTAWNFLAVPVSNTDIKLTWDWWPAGNNTVQIAIYYGLYYYPIDLADGTLIYQGTGDAYTHTNLSPGTTYYYRAWLLCGGNYSADYVQDWATTYGSSPVVSPPEQPEGWFQDPNCIAYSKIPLLSDALIAVTTAYGFPATTVCVMFTLLWIIVLGLAVFLFIHSAMMMIITIAVLIILTSIMGLLPLWMIVIAICLGGISIYISGRT